MKKKINYAEIMKETGILTVAVAIIAAAVYFFLVPSHASVSSISGLGIVLANFIPLPLSAITMILNVVLLLIGFVTCGREFGVKTVYTSVMLPIFLGLFEILFPNFGSLTDSQELDVLCYILVVSVGLSILFNRNASSGGLDIVAKIMNKYLHMELGKAMSLSGMCVALSAALVYDKKTVVLSILGTYFNGIILDHFIFDNNIKRRVCTSAPDFLGGKHYGLQNKLQTLPALGHQSGGHVCRRYFDHQHPCWRIPERREVLYRCRSELAGHGHHQCPCGYYHRCRHDRIPSDRLQLRSGDRREHPHPHPLCYSCGNVCNRHRHV